MKWPSVYQKQNCSYKLYATSEIGRRVQQMINCDMISTGHARALLAIDDKDEQYNLANRIFDEKLSVRDTEKLVKEIKNRKRQKKK